MNLKLYNTAKKEVVKFKPMQNNQVKLYTCGPTVYDYAHIGNLRSYIFEDVLKRTLIFNGFKVKHVMNITDVGHLTSDADLGEDKMEIRAAKENKTVTEIAKKYTNQFLKDTKRLNIIEPDILTKATSNIKEQIEFIKKLETKGFIYQTKDGVYFNTAKFPRYGNFARLDIKGLKAGARIKNGIKKKNITDFALWKFSPQNKSRLQEWKSPWGVGFPGWHIECSAMAMKYLGEQIDIHCGGIEHIPVHHTNEIAQTESLTGKKFANFWLHNEHLLFEGKKMSKSKGNYAILQDLVNKNYCPLAYRHLILTAHYRSKINFTWESLQSSQHYLNNLYRKLKDLEAPTNIDSVYLEKFTLAINNDLDTPQALAIMQELLKAEINSDIKAATLIKFDEILALNIKNYISKTEPIPQNIKDLLAQREQARLKKDFKNSDFIRSQILELGYEIKDSPSGPKIVKI